MKVFISADMEGISGVSNWEEMKRYRDELNALMTGDLNAVVEGILDAAPDADEIVVADSHSDALNIVYRDLHPRVSLVRGHPRPRYMMAGLDASFDRAFFVGYHSALGAERGLMDHTYSSSVIRRISVGGRALGEFEINAAYAAELGVPPAFVSGDLDFCRHVESLGLGVERVVTKEWAGRFAAKHRPLPACRAALREGARRATLLDRGSLALPAFTLPVRAELETTSGSRADLLSEIPTFRRTGGLTLAFEAESAAAFLGALMTAIRVGLSVER